MKTTRDAGLGEWSATRELLVGIIVRKNGHAQRQTQIKSLPSVWVTRWKVLRESTTPRESEIWGVLSPTLGNTCYTYY